MKSGRPPMAIGSMTGPQPEQMGKSGYRGMAGPSISDEIIPVKADNPRLTPGSGFGGFGPHENHLRHPSDKSFGQLCKKPPC